MQHRYDSTPTLRMNVDEIREALASAADAYVCPTCAGTGMVGEDRAAEHRRGLPTDRPPPERDDA